MSSGTYYYFIEPSKSKLSCIQLQIHVEPRTAIRGLPWHGGKITPTSERHVDVNEEKTDDNRCGNKPARWRHGINTIDHAILQQIQQHTTWTFSSSLHYKKTYICIWLKFSRKMLLLYTIASFVFYLMLTSRYETHSTWLQDLVQFLTAAILSFVHHLSLIPHNDYFPMARCLFFRELECIQCSTDLCADALNKQPLSTTHDTSESDATINIILCSSTAIITFSSQLLTFTRPILFLHDLAPLRQTAHRASWLNWTLTPSVVTLNENATALCASAILSTTQTSSVINVVSITTRDLNPLLSKSGPRMQRHNSRTNLECCLSWSQNHTLTLLCAMKHHSDTVWALYMRQLSSSIIKDSSSCSSPYFDLLQLEFGRCTHRTSKSGNIGARWNISELASANCQCQSCRK